MRAPSIRSGGQDPGYDGDVNRYTAPEADGQSWFDNGRRVIFVNGMMNTPEDHAKSARALSVLQACPVVGVFNKKDGFWADLGQCITDKATLASFGMQSIPGLTVGPAFSDWKRAVDALHLAARALDVGISRVDLVGKMISGNAATYALYSLLIGDGGVGLRVPIYCHSQGNLVTSNALTAVALAKGIGAVAGMEVNSYGSPCRFWPSGISRTNNAYTFDPVSWLDLSADLSSSKVGFKVAHGFDEYMKQDGEFVVNRFRWGGFAMTASMDEEGLAEFCIGLGNNPERLRRIFTRLEDAHWSDSDDVAYEYSSRASSALLRSIASADPGVICQLIRMLESGFTTWGEKEQIARLRAAL